jgi:hypothetical protein
MEFEAFVSGEPYRFSSLNQQTVLISGPRSEYILYKRAGQWLCADEIRKDLLKELSDVLNEHRQLVN